jgi:hypothetical protein
MIKMLRIYSKAFLENVIIEELTPGSHLGAGANRTAVLGFIAFEESHSSRKVSIFTYVPHVWIWEEEVFKK